MNLLHSGLNRKEHEIRHAGKVLMMMVMVMMKESKMMMLRRRILMGKTDAKTGKHARREPAQSKCTCTIHVSHIVWKSKKEEPTHSGSSTQPIWGKFVLGYSLTNAGFRPAQAWAIRASHAPLQCEKPAREPTVPRHSILWPGNDWKRKTHIFCITVSPRFSLCITTYFH